MEFFLFGVRPGVLSVGNALINRVGDFAKREFIFILVKMRFGMCHTHCRLWCASALAVASFVACSNNDVAGNSAETGSPELAGMLVLDNGTPADFAHVRCVPRGFNARAGQMLPRAFVTDADSNGNYALDSIPPGEYSLEAEHAHSGKVLLVQGLTVEEDGELALNDTLRETGEVKLLVPGVFDEGSTGVATVIGTTILRQVTVVDGKIVVDSLPAETLDLVVYMNGADSLSFSEVSIEPSETSVVGDTLQLFFRAPLALPAGVDSIGVSTDIPFSLHLDSTSCDIDSLYRLSGRWEAFRVSPDGSRSQLPIADPVYEQEPKSIAFWVRVDSLNVDDEIELMLNTAKDASYAKDVFPTSRAYRAVYHFETVQSPLANDAEKSVTEGEFTKASVVDGVIGNAVSFSGAGSVVTVEGSNDVDGNPVGIFERNFADAMSFSLWVRLDAMDKRVTIFTKGETQYNLKYAPDSGFVFSMYHEPEAVKLDTAGKLASDTSSYRLYFATGDSLVKKDEWTFISFSYSGGVARLLVNGMASRPLGEREAWNGTRDKSGVFTLGGFEGAVDEFFFAAGGQGAEWMTATYLNQSRNWPLFE